MPYWRLFCHLVWATKNREAIVTPSLEVLLNRSFERTCSELQIDLLAIGLMPDHVHLVVAIPPKVAVAEAVKQLKGTSSRFVAQELRGMLQADSFVWQREYGALTVGERPLPQAIAYVLDQRARHASGELNGALERISDIQSLKGTFVP